MLTLTLLVAIGKSHSWLLVCGTCIWFCAQMPEKQNAKPALHCKTKTLLVSLDMEWKTEAGASLVVSNVRYHLDKSFLSVEGWNVRLCCGLEVQINVRREELAQCRIGRVVVGQKTGGIWNINDVDILR